MGFIVPKNSFDTVKIDVLIAVLEKIGCPTVYLTLIKALYSKKKKKQRQ